MDFGLLPVRPCLVVGRLGDSKSAEFIYLARGGEVGHAALGRRIPQSSHFPTHVRRIYRFACVVQSP